MSDLKKTRDHVEPNAKTLWLLRCASDKRAQGLSWANVALTLKRKLCVWQHWLRRYPSTWDQLLREAEGRVFREVGSEALTIMRCLLRSESETIRRDVGRTITVLAFRMPRDNTGEIPESDATRAAMDQLLMEFAHDDDHETAAGPPAVGTAGSDNSASQDEARAGSGETGPG